MQTELLYSIFKDSTGVTTDSRNIRKGGLFFGLWGESYNGNKFASEALTKGASYAVIDDPDFETDKTILVDDTLLELQALATHYRKELKIPVIAITGTNGKTTTKELLAAVLSKKYKINYTKGNLNNHLGVPLTILSTPADTELLIVEMGASHIGEIKTLCEIARPDYGIITNIGKAHIEGFGSFEGIIKAKIELYEYLKKVNGVAIYNDKNVILSEKIFKLLNRAIPYSDPTGAELITEIINDSITLSLIATYNHQTFEIKTNLFGEYNFENVKAALATGLFFGVDFHEALLAIEGFIPSNNRSEIRKISSNTLICDSYNSNPTSLSKAIEAFAQTKSENKVCILGDMLELGDSSVEEHLNILNFIKSFRFKKVYLVGNIFGNLSTQFGYEFFSDSELLASYLKQSPITNSLILIKGSRGMMLEKIYNVL